MLQDLPRQLRFSKAQGVLFTGCTITAIIAILALSGWIFDIGFLKSVFTSAGFMKPNTAVAFLCLSAATVCLRSETDNRWALAAGFTGAAICMLLALTTLSEYLLNTNVGIDQYLFRDSSAMNTASYFSAGRPAPISLVNFSFLSTALFVMNWPSLRRYRIGQFFVFMVLISSIQSLVGYAINLPSLFGSAYYAQMGLHASIAFISLSLAILASRPNEGFIEAFGSNSPSSIMARRMLFAIITTPLLVRWIANTGFRLHLYDQDFPDLIQLIGGMIIMGGILIWSATLLYHSERDREDARLKAESANRAKTNFLANISHEIRTPLGAVLGFSELLASEKNDEQQRGDLKAAIRRNGDQLLRLIDDLLDISKIEAGHLNLEKKSFCLLSFLEDVGNLARLKCDENGLFFHMVYLTALPETISTDRNRLRQVLLNVIGNAIKFNKEGGKVTVSAEFVPTTPPVLHFSVRDNGHGISRDAAARLFQPFSQGDASATRKFGGSGLGLALSRKITQALGGDLVLSETTLGNGSLFSIEIDPGPLESIRLLDLNAVAEARDMARVAAAKSSVLPLNLKVPSLHELKGAKILLVEDSPDNRALVSRFLKASGAAVDCACDGLEGVQKALLGNFDIVLMDLQMPNLDGYDAIKRLRGIGYKVPIIALTAHAFKEDRDRCLKIGFNEHLTKPVNKIELIHTVESFVHDAIPDRL